jgi:Metallo-peptidase family M12B Reprolysin-like
VKFREDEDLYDFEIVMRHGDDCDASGCVLASAFFPDGGRHKLTLFPKLFEQTRQEQVATLVHEIGHVFGLRHFFAQISETEWPSEIFGTHSKFSIMNYGSLSRLTTADRDDLRRLYRRVWTGKMTEINGTPIRLMRPYSAKAASHSLLALDAEPQSLPRAATVVASR